MKNRNLRLTIIILLTAVYSMVQAQHHGACCNFKSQKNHPPIPDANHIEKMVTKITKELSLNKDQETKIRTLHKEHFAIVRKKLSDKTKTDRAVMDELKKTFVENIKSNLTPKQQKKFVKFIKNRKHHKGKHGERRRRRIRE